MPQDPIRLALILGSTREGRFCDTVARWVEAQAHAHGGFVVDVVDPAREDGARTIPARLHAADAFVIVTPEYNHGYPAPLKALIDAVGQPWQAKPVAFVSYGGISGGLRAVEQLRQVFAELHAVTMRDCVSFANAWHLFAQDGALREPDASRAAMRTLLARLCWWSLALRQARQANPYANAA
ncbi:NADPH-dependent FMN reductase [Luteimonas aquatica]|uniref:NADPH-dependent FMN reductase n=1 Tax=Luteimonas aquatica TaxID=450364 RepID=UPI001F58B02A|nr:NAD(P)H-dependent oxidoreductase [Luteimonas aquatica]